MKKQNNNTIINIHGNSKTVIDLTTNTTYNSLKEAAEAMGVHLSSISLVVRGKTKTCKGHRFCFAEDTNTVSEEFTPIKLKAGRGFPKAKKVKDMTTGEIYESITEAAKALGVHRSSVGYAANGNIKTCKKHIFRFVDDIPTETTSHHIINKSMPVYRGKSVLCITNGEVYKSVKEAAYVNNLSYASVHAVCYGKQTSINGLAFCYLEDAPYRVMDIVTGIRKNLITKELAIHKERQETLLKHKEELDAKQAEILKELEELNKEINDIESKLN